MVHQFLQINNTFFNTFFEILKIITGASKTLWQTYLKNKQQQKNKQLNK